MGQAQSWGAYPAQRARHQLQTGHMCASPGALGSRVDGVFCRRGAGQTPAHPSPQGEPRESLPCLHPRSADPSPKDPGFPLSRHSVSLATFKLTVTDLWCSFEIFAGEERVDS